MSLIAWYKLDGNAQDSSGNGLNGTILNSPTLVTGKLGNAYKFKSQPDGISIPNNFLLANFTMSAWINPAGNHYNYDGAILSSGNWNSSHWSFGVKQNNSGFSCRGMGASPVHAFTLNTWHFILCKREGTNTKIFVDGEQLWEGTSSSNIPLASNASNTCIGRETYAGGHFGFNGSIDDVRIYDHALSEREIKELAKAKVLHYTFDDFQEPTENLFTVDNFLNSLSYHTVENYDNVYPDKPICRRLTRTSEANTYYNYSTNFPISGGKSYTFSFYMRLISVASEPNFIYAYMSDDVTANTSQVTTGNLYLNYNWQRVELTIDTEPTATSLDRIAFHTGASSIKLNTVFEIANPQLEAKDHATPFVNGTRTGSVTDSSGYDNHADLALTTTPQWTEDSKIGSGAYKNYGSTSVYLNTPYGNGINVTDYPHTFSMWVYPVDGSSTQIFFSTPNGTNQRIYFAIRSGKWDMGIQASAWGKGLTSVVANQWSHVAVVMDGSYAKMYINGEFSFQKAYTSYSFSSNFKLFSRSDYFFNGLMDDVRIYATALSADDIKELYQTRASIDDKGNLFINNINETGHKPLLMDYTAWVNGTSNSKAGNMENYGSQNRIVIGSDPWGKEIPLWESYGVDNTTTGSGIYGGYNSIDNTKLYRMSWWEKRISNGNATYGRYYAGLNGSPSGVWNLSSDTYNTNPYFWSTSRTGLPIGEWFLVVGHVWPHTYTGGVNHKDSGRWRLDGSKIGDISQDFRSGPATTILRSRTLSIYQGNDGGLLHHTAYPRMDLCDGSEPTIDELLSGFDSNYIEYIREKGGTAGISLNVGNKDTYLGEINEIGMPVRYIKESMVGSSANTGNHWVEIQAFNSSDVNIALGKTAVSSLLTDGNTASSPYYSTGPATVDLGDVYLIDYLKIWHYYADARTYYKIKTEVSADNINWITVFDSDIDGQYVETSAGKEIILYPNKASIREDGSVLVKELNEGF